jgi:3-methylcrotonyl-CoA carboxylase beta subunit
VPTLRELTDEVAKQEQVLRQGGGAAGQERQRKLGRLPVRERLSALLDADRPFLEFGLWAAWGMYREWGEVPAAGVVCGVGWISGRACMVIANDATVKAGAMFPQSIKKVLRAQKVAFQLRLPLVYLVDSAGVFLPMQDEIFPDEDDFGRIFRNNSVLSAAGIPQYSAVMGNCIAGGAYLPVLCDKILMTEGSQMCLAGPALVKAAIGQVVDPEELGGAKMHAEISGTADFHEKDDPACLQRLRLACCRNRRLRALALLHRDRLTTCIPSCHRMAVANTMYGTLFTVWRTLVRSKNTNPIMVKRL